MSNLPAPTATADSTEHADWLEFSALLASRGLASAQDLVAALRRSGSSDAIEDRDELEDVTAIEEEGGGPSLDTAVEKESEELNKIADAALEQLERREQYLGEQYPFNLNGALKAKPDALKTTYAFLTAVTCVGWKNEPEAPPSPASLFEYLSAAALVSYLGGEGIASSYDFGFPRRNSPQPFYDAVEDLCLQMGEGGGCGTTRPDTSSVNDDKLDLVVWVPFGDDRPNQLSVFGQCATGRNWRSKINELQPVDFCKRWFHKQPAMHPALAFFVPRQIKEDHWQEAANGDRRLVFDRLRIARLLKEIDQSLADSCAQWTESVLS